MAKTVGPIDERRIMILGQACMHTLWQYTQGKLEPETLVPSFKSYNPGSVGSMQPDIRILWDNGTIQQKQVGEIFEPGVTANVPDFPAPSVKSHLNVSFPDPTLRKMPGVQPGKLELSFFLLDHLENLLKLRNVSEAYQEVLNRPAFKPFFVFWRGVLQPSEHAKENAREKYACITFGEFFWLTSPSKNEIATEIGSM